MAEITHLADHLVIMGRGTITAAGPLHILQSDPALPLAASHEAAVSVDAAVGGYDGRYGLLILRLKGARLLVPAAPLAPGLRQRLHIAASDVSVTREAPRSSTILNVFPARIKACFPLGASRSLWCLRSAPAARVRTFWRGSRVTRLIRYGLRTEWTYLPSSSTSRWSRPQRRHRKPQRPPGQQEIPDRQASLLETNQ